MAADPPMPSVTLHAMIFPAARRGHIVADHKHIRVAVADHNQVVPLAPVTR